MLSRHQDNLSSNRLFFAFLDFAFSQTLHPHNMHNVHSEKQIQKSIDFRLFNGHDFWSLKCEDAMGDITSVIAL